MYPILRSLESFKWVALELHKKTPNTFLTPISCCGYIGLTLFSLILKQGVALLPPNTWQGWQYHQDTSPMIFMVPQYSNSMHHDSRYETEIEHPTPHNFYIHQMHYCCCSSNLLALPFAYPSCLCSEFLFCGSLKIIYFTCSRSTSHGVAILLSHIGTYFVSGIYIFS